MSGDRFTSKRLPRHKFTLLLVALFFLLIVAPLLEGTPFGGAIYAIGIAAVFITGLAANRKQKCIFRAALVVAVVARLVSAMPAPPREEGS